MAAETDNDKDQTSRSRGLIQRIGLAADLVTLAFAASALAVPVVGIVVNQPQLGLIVGLTISVLLNLALAVALARRRAELRSLSVIAEQLRSRVEESKRATKAVAPAAPPPSNRWIGDHTDPTTLKITTVEFEKAYNGAVAIARERLGSDAVVRFWSLEVMYWLGRSYQTDYPHLQFDGFSPNAEREALIVCNGLDETPYINSVTRGRKEPSGVAHAESPWRSDTSWHRLIDASWDRMRPFTGSMSVRYDEHGWFVEYGRTVDDEDEPQVRFRLDPNGALVSE